MGTVQQQLLSFRPAIHHEQLGSGAGASKARLEKDELCLGIKSIQTMEHHNVNLCSIQSLLISMSMIVRNVFFHDFFMELCVVSG